MKTTRELKENSRILVSAKDTSSHSNFPWLTSKTLGRIAEPVNVNDKITGEQKQTSRLSMDRGTPEIQRASVIQWIGSDINPGNYSNGNKAATSEQTSVKIEPAGGALNKSHASGSPFISSNKKKKFICRFCGKWFQWFSHWQAHERTHTGERPFKCELCDKRFTRSDGLKCHRLSHRERNTSSSCVYQGKNNTKQAQKQCELTLKYRDTIRTAKTTKREIRFCKCRFCERSFLSPADLDRHIKHHEGRKEFKCDSCNTTFSKQSALKIHRRVHTGERPYRCNICTKAFSIYGNLKRHLLIHTGERPYTCSMCSSSFNNPSHLTRHVKRKHMMPHSAL